ncbi:MAG: hypothetical protein ACKV2V_17480, partial [Blastocatellia bacterium]
MLISTAGWRSYLWSCGLLIVPILVWNLVLSRFLPPAFAPDEFWREIPPFVRYGENILRFAVLLLPFLMPLEVTTDVQRRGLQLFVVGTVFYVLAWCALILYPLLNRDYPLMEKVNMWLGKSRSGVSSLWKTILATDLSRQVPELDLPVYFFEGIYDYTCSYTEAKSYFEKLKAPLKRFYSGLQVSATSSRRDVG